MTFGCCVNLLPQGAGPAGSGYAREIKEAGYDYIELPLSQLEALGEREFEELRGLLGALDLPCPCCNAFLPPALRVTGEDRSPDAELERYLSRAFGRMEALGAAVAGFGSPQSRSCPPGFSPDRALDQIEAFLRRAGELAADHGVVVALEHVSGAESNVLNHYGDVLSMARRIGAPQVRTLCDYYHLRWEGDDPRALLDGGVEWLVHTHIAALEGRRYLTGLEGETPALQAYAGVLRELGYAGGVSVEAQTESRAAWRREAEQTLALLRQVFQ